MRLGLVRLSQVRFGKVRVKLCYVMFVLDMVCLARLGLVGNVFLNGIKDLTEATTGPQR